MCGFQKLHNDFDIKKIGSTQEGCIEKKIPPKNTVM